MTVGRRREWLLRWRWPLLFSGLGHALVVLGALLVQKKVPAPTRYVEVSLHVRAPAPPPPVEAPHVHPPEPHPKAPPVPRPKPTPAPQPRKPKPVRRKAAPKPKAAPRPRSRVAPPPQAAPRATPHPARVGTPKGSPPPLAGLGDALREGPGLAIPLGDPHGHSLHGHPHGTPEGRGSGEPTPPEPEPAPLAPPPLPPPPPPKPKPKPKPAGPLTASQLSRQPKPRHLAKARYPRAARSMGLEGHVLLELLIDEKGRVKEARVRRSLGMGCDEAARKAMLRSRFIPALDKRGRPASTRVLFRYRFVLDEDD